MSLDILFILNMFWLCCSKRQPGNERNSDLKSDSRSTQSHNSISNIESLDLEDSCPNSDEEIKFDNVILDESFCRADSPIKRPASLTVETGTQTFNESLVSKSPKDDIFVRRKNARSSK